jgi:hypothetical protein
MRHLLWAVLMLAALVIGVWIVIGPWNPRNDFELFAVMVFFMGSPIGGFWMIYRSIRYEKRPVPYVILALVPMSFLWYYVERVRPLKFQTSQDASQNANG